MPHRNKSSPASREPAGNRFWLLTLGSLGVVYGDIGTSPLYAFREAMRRVAGAGGVPGSGEILGIISLILWSLLIIVTLKYILFLLHADNRGEGGMLSLTALAQKGMKRYTGFVFFLGIVGAALFYGDASITPAISVLSAVEGLKLITPAFTSVVLPLSMLILVGLFMVQKNGTRKVSNFFGPVMALWMLLLGASGIPHIVAQPHILLALLPNHAVMFLLQHRSMALTVLGAVFLAITGAEALYEDLGHFGRQPIQTAWLVLVLPCLILNYMGQGALLLDHPEAISNPFFLMMPPWALLPVVLLATLATIIASQAVISGTYSITRSAIHLGMLPRMEIKHTSAAREGQIYMPKVNRLLMLAVLFLIVMFRSSAALASAYGIAVTGTLLVTSALIFIVIWRTWKRSIWLAAALVLPFAAIELVFLAANILKIFDGGIVPLLLAGLLVTIMSVWVRGSRYLLGRIKRQTIPLHELIQQFSAAPPIFVRGTAIFLTTDAQSAPMALLQNLKHNKIMHAQNIVLSVVTNPVPKVPAANRAVVELYTPYLTGITLHFGYGETPDVPQALGIAQSQGFLQIDLRDVSYFLGRRTLIADERRGLPQWQNKIFIPMVRAATDLTDFYHLPAGKVVELGVQIAI